MHLLSEHAKDSSTLSVKKHLRLQKMALQGLDYRPKHE